MSTARTERIIKKGVIKSLLEGEIELKDLAGSSPDLELARMAYLQELTETSLANQGKTYVLTASDTIQLEDLGEEAHATNVYAKKKQFTILTSGILRLTGEIKTEATYTAYCEIRINGAEIGIVWTTTETTYQPKTADVAIGEGDLLQMWIKSSGAVNNSYLKNARVRCTSELEAPQVGTVS